MGVPLASIFKGRWRARTDATVGYVWQLPTCIYPPFIPPFARGGTFIWFGFNLSPFISPFTKGGQGVGGSIYKRGTRCGARLAKGDKKTPHKSPQYGKAAARCTARGGVFAWVVFKQSYTIYLCSL